jgi:hypothetical protein
MFAADPVDKMAYYKEAVKPSAVNCQPDFLFLG